MVIFSNSADPNFHSPTTGQTQFTDPEKYYIATLASEPNELLDRALSIIAAKNIEPGLAIDLGCGSGRGTVRLLNAGWQVIAIDKEPSAFKYLLNRNDLITTSNLQTLISPMEDLSSLPSVDLFYAAFVLPFCQPTKFKMTWEEIVKTVRPGGHFAGHFFGDRDTWANNPMQTHHTLPALDKLFEQFTIEHLKEVEDDNPTVLGEPKHWHVFHVVACKKFA